MQRDSRAGIRRAVFAGIKSKGSEGQYEQIRRQSPALQRFTSVAGLLTFMREPDPSKSDEKDAVLYALLRSARPKDATGKGATTLLLATMWPALEHSYYRLFQRLRSAADPFSEVYWAFLEEVRLWNPQKRSYVAIELVRRTERRVRRAVRREEQYQAACREMLEAARAAGPGGLRAIGEEEREARLSENDKADAEVLLAEFVNRDVISLEESMLIAGHALYGRKLRDMAADSGVGYRTVSKRYQRAVSKVRGASRGTVDFF